MDFFLRLLKKFIIDKLLAAVYIFYFQKRDKNYNFNIFNKLDLTDDVLPFGHNEKKINNLRLSFHYDIFFALGSKFKEKKFDIIWIDGDHLAPQVQFDIFQAIKAIINRNNNSSGSYY